MERVAAHEVFNMINNMFPLCFIDFRGEQAFAACHVRNSKLAPHELAQECVADGIQACIPSHLSGSSRITVMLVVHESATSNLESTHSICHHDNGSWFPASRSCAEAENGETGPDPWGMIKDIKYVVFEDLFPRYERCEEMFTRSGEKDDKGKKYRRVYYATEIVPEFLFLGDYVNGTDASQIASLGITHIVDATNEHLSEGTAASLELHYLPVDIWDMPESDIAAHFEASNTFIGSAYNSEEKRGKVLVHCRAGWSRSPSIVLAFLIHARIAPSLRAALELVLHERPMVVPNEGFREQLREYEIRVLGSASVWDDDIRWLLNGSNFKSKYSGGIAFEESEFDRIPIAAAKVYKAGLGIAQLSEYQDENESGVCAAVQPKRAFLRRGQGAVGKSLNKSVHPQSE